MSYILEALKKSKEERLKEESPHLHIVHETLTYTPPSIISLRTGLICGGLGFLFIVGFFFFSDGSEKNPDVATEAGRSVNLHQIQIRSQFFEQEENSVVVTEPIETIVKKTALEQDAPEVLKILKSKNKKVFQKVSGVDGQEGIAEHQEILYRKDLPSDIQQNLPKFVFAGHTYADDPKRRMIIINNAIRREGDTIDANTRLLNITWEGVVLDYKGIVFKQRTH